MKVTGFYGPVEENGGLDALRSLSFYTNKGKYGPFGDEIGTYFASFPRNVVGFHGRAGVYLDDLSVHTEYIQPSAVV
ncbi:hypothetical protein AQUCO_02000380v1 [Aquilegia coerulea]|uniref:Jacalin-type lectin domain-containing protein n=1 Tax=Aquilegia coerulea TaxID=218851 RepID=A0A2G5DHB2_AQUCA|nr:hypothetical protein AQUCO_02000380v1 [Aquilegia coerulea]